MELEKIIPEHNGIINVIIETPRGSKTKYNYDAELKLLKLSKVLPTGMAFPLDFGFLPNTKGEDGDPLDVMVLMDEPGYPGCLVECRIAGIMQAIQTERDGRKLRNDRSICIGILSPEMLPNVCRAICRVRGFSIFAASATSFFRYLSSMFILDAIILSLSNLSVISTLRKSGNTRSLSSSFIASYCSKIFNTFSDTFNESPFLFLPIV